MERKFHVLVMAALLLVPAAAAAQAPPQGKPPLAPKKEMRDPDACVEAPATVGKGGDLDLKNPEDRTLSGQLAESQGVICPPPHVDPEMKKPAPGGGTMPVIPPPGSPGGNPYVQPK
jgi:hypothetical protein